MNMVQTELGPDEIQMELDQMSQERSEGQRALGIHLKATMEGNLTGFPPMREATEEAAFTCEDIGAWLGTMSVLGQCPSLGQRAAEYAKRVAVDEERNKGWLWLNKPRNHEFWSFMDEEH